MTNEIQIKLRQTGYKGEFELSELIAACGDDLIALIKNTGLGWSCEFVKHRNGETDQQISDFFKTPEEAVANLWLALNKK